MKPTLAALALLAAGASHAETRYFSLFYKGDRVGYNAVEEGQGTLGGGPVRWTRTHSVGTLNYATTPIHLEEDEMVWTTPEGRPLKESVTMLTMGKRVKIDVAFGPKTAEVDLVADGKRTHQSVPIPAGLFVDDELALVRKGLAPGASLAFSSFEVHALAFQRSTLKSDGPTTVEVDGKTVPAVLTEITDEDGVTKLYTSLAGALLREESPNDTAMRAVSKAVALAPLGPLSEASDLMHLTALKGDRPILDAEHRYRVRLRVTGMDLSKAPSDETQTVTRDGDAWIVELHPTVFGQDGPEIPFADLAKGKEAWSRPAPLLSSDDPKLKATAQKIVEGRSRFDGAVLAVEVYVDGHMKYEVGFGDDRDAKEVLRHPTGKCTDYAILSAALLRAVGVPTRIAAGLYEEDGEYYYHAWCEGWDGRKWVGLDSTDPGGWLKPHYLKLAEGGVKEAFALPFPEDPQKVKIEVLPDEKPKPVSAKPAP